ncbi:hypothetical protein [Photorhabdus laumondii]|uniref:hypothetical protein n=1 Tax=Photorhabdus laumondii TaxID=2218628 RepID=UPI0025AF9B6A|nr:hypothetical protein [Photorhabdus laumondii]
MARKYNSIKDVFSELIRQYSNPENIDENGQSLIFKEYVWNFDDLDSLIKSNFDINQVDCYGNTPIFYCTDKYKFRLLLINGENIHHTDSNHRNLLFYPNDLDNLRLMLKLGININTIDIKGYTCLSHELFHQKPDAFIDYLYNFKNQHVEIFQFFENSENCLKILSQNSIKYTLAKRIFFNYNPLKYKEISSILLKYLDLSIDKKHHSELRFIYKPIDDSMSNIYTFEQLIATLSKG